MKEKKQCSEVLFFNDYIENVKCFKYNLLQTPITALRYEIRFSSKNFIFKETFTHIRFLIDRTITIFLFSMVLE